MPSNPQNPLVIQSDRTVLLEVQNDFYEAARDALARFAELEKSPEHVAGERKSLCSQLTIGCRAQRSVRLKLCCASMIMSPFGLDRNVPLI